MKLSLDGKQYEINLDDLDFDDADTIEDYNRMTTKDFVEELFSGNPRMRVLRTLILLARRKAGEDVTWAELGKLRMVPVVREITADADTTPDPDPDVAAEKPVEQPEAVAKLKRTRRRTTQTVTAPALTEPEPAAG